MSLLAIVQPRQAIADLRHLLTIDPRNKEAASQLDQTVKLIRRLEFEKAIATDETESPSARCKRIIADGGCAIEDGYKGPMPEKRDGEDGVGMYRFTQEFVDLMIEWFRAGKTLCRRLAWEIVLGAHEILKKEKTLVDVDVKQGETIRLVASCRLCRVGIAQSPLQSQHPWRHPWAILRSCQHL